MGSRGWTAARNNPEEVEAMERRTLMALAAGVFLGGLVACGGGGSPDLGLGRSSGGTPFNAVQPPALWTNDGCVACHGPDGAGTSAGPDIRCTSFARIDVFVRTAPTSHPGGVFPQLTDANIDDLVAFLRTPACSANTPTSPAVGGNPPASHTQSEDGVLHHPDYKTNLATCTACHGANLEGSSIAPACASCHGTDHINDDGEDEAGENHVGERDSGSEDSGSENSGSENSGRDGGRENGGADD